MAACDFADERVGGVPHRSTSLYTDVFLVLYHVFVDDLCAFPEDFSIGVISVR